MYVLPGYEPHCTIINRSTNQLNTDKAGAPYVWTILQGKLKQLK